MCAVADILLHMFMHSFSHVQLLDLSSFSGCPSIIVGLTFPNDSEVFGGKVYMCFIVFWAVHLGLYFDTI